MSSKARCSICRLYFLKEDMHRTGLGGLGGVCSPECLQEMEAKYRAKRIRRKEHRDAKYSGGRRLTGTARDRVKRRDDCRCRWCGTTAEVQIHHCFYRSEGGRDTPRNLISICARCHALAHTNKKKYQPVLLTWLWLFYVQEKEMDVESVFRLIQWTQSEDGSWYAKRHQDWVDAARAFCKEIHAENKVA